MLRILIADDERLIRKGLEDLLAAEEGFSVVAAVSNGEEALEAVRRDRPDVVLTDIRMPRMDGRELVRALHLSHPGIRKVIISGYEDFSYAHETMKHGALDYLLKPVDEIELVALLRRIEAEVQDEEKQRHESIDIRDKLGRSLPLLREELIRSLLNGAAMSDEEIAGRLEYLGLKAGSGPYCAVFISFGCYRQNGAKGCAKSTAGDIAPLAEKTLCSNSRAFMCEDGGSLACIISCPPGQDPSLWSPEAAAGELFTALKANLKAEFTVCLGDAVPALSRIGGSYAHARQALKQRFYGEGPALLRYADTPRPVCGEAARQLFDNYAEKFYAGFTNAVELEKTDTVRAMLNEAKAFLKDNAVEPNEALRFFSDLFAMQQAQNHEFKSAAAEQYGTDYLYLKAIEQFDSLGEIILYSMQVYAEIIERIKAHRSRKDKKRVEIVKEFIEKNYKENITLSRISDLVYVNPNYFCEMFKSQTGENFVDYLTRVRMEKAKALLRNMKIKTYEAGAMVGYEDSGYFCKVFKKLVGITPGKYRNLKM